MLFVLSPAVIADITRSLAAYAVLGAEESEHAALRPLLDPARRGLLVNMARQAFAETILRLSPYVDDCALDDEDCASDPGHTAPDTDPEDMMMKVELRLPATLPDSAGWSVRRSIEQAVAYTALSRLTATTDGGSRLAERCAAVAESTLAGVAATLAHPAVHAFIRR